MLTIIASMECELAGLRRELQPPRFRNGGQERTNGPQPRLVETYVVGVGRSQSQSSVNCLLTEHLTDHRDLPDMGAEEPRELLLLGFAGAVEADLQTGDLILSQRYYRAESEEADCLSPDPAMMQRALEAAAEACLPANNRNSLTVKGLVATPEGKAELGRRYPVGVVAMEDYWVAAVAREAGVPFLSARVVLDPANQRLPGYLVGLAQAQYRAVLSAVAMPWRIPTLLGLGRQVRLAQQVLTQFALSYINQLSADARPMVGAKLAHAAVRQGSR